MFCKGMDRPYPSPEGMHKAVDKFVGLRLWIAPTGRLRCGVQLFGVTGERCQKFTRY